MAGKKRKREKDRSKKTEAYSSSKSKASKPSQTQKQLDTEKATDDFSPGWSARYYKRVSNQSEGLARKTDKINKDERKAVHETQNNHCLGENDIDNTVNGQVEIPCDSRMQRNSDVQQRSSKVKGKNYGEMYSKMKPDLTLKEQVSGFHSNHACAGTSNDSIKIENASKKPVLLRWPCRSDVPDVKCNPAPVLGKNEHNNQSEEIEPPTSDPSGSQRNRQNDHRKRNQRKHRRKTKKYSSSDNIQKNEEKKSSEELEIPGFYYDKKKQRYFKILPTSNNPGFITPESLKKEQEENKRQKLLKYLMFDNIPPSKIRGRILRSSGVSRGCVLSCLNDRTSGIMSSSQCSKSLLMHKISRLRPTSQAKVFDQPVSVYEKLEHMKFILPTLDGSKYMCLWSLKSELSQRMQIISLKCQVDSGKERGAKLRVVHHQPSDHLSLSKVTTMCWAPWSPEDTTSHYVLYTTMSLFGNNNNNNCATIRNMDPTSEGAVTAVFGLSSKMTWSCAWNPHQKQFCVGTEKCGLLCDPFKRRLWELSTKNSDVLALKFSEENGNLLFSGIRKGEILTHDLRSSSTYAVSSLRHSSSISWLQQLRDNNYLLASDFSGKICQWDLRTRHIVQSFQGHHNEYMRLPFYVNETHQLVYSVGQDSHCRIWNLTSGNLLHTVPSPYPAAIDEIPTVTMATDIPGLKSSPTLILGAQDSMHLYTF